MSFIVCFVTLRLPRKTDIERKIEIYTFSARTRQLFVRLLALVKWANSASKVDKSAVSILLSLQNMDTSNRNRNIIVIGNRNGLIICWATFELIEIFKMIL